MYLVDKYIMLASHNLKRFKRKDQYSWNFRCPFCGDSSTSLTKARGYLLSKGSKCSYFCHNCQVKTSFANLLKQVDLGLHDQYIKEMLHEKYKGNVNIKPGSSNELANKMKTKPYKKNSALRDLKSISQLEHNHYAKVYVNSRKILPKFHHKLYFAPAYYTLVNQFIAGKYKQPTEQHPDHPRLLIPLLDADQNMFGFQGRLLDQSDSPKYITTLLDETHVRVFGLDTVNFNHTYYCVEGPIDAMYLSNAIASCGGSILSIIEQLKCNRNNAIICYDNQPRNKQVCAMISKAINANYKVFIWPDNVDQKDIGQMIEQGFSSATIEQMITSNTFRGLNAKLRFSQWRKTSL